MKMFVVFVILLHVSQHALAVVVEVNEGEQSVLLPCQFSGIIPEYPAVIWTRSDLHPKSVHLQREGRDDFGGQNQRYSGRTSMRPDALDTGDFSLTLRKPTKTDSGNHICSLSDGREELRVTDIQLQVKDDQEEVTTWKMSDFIILPCKTNLVLPEDTTVEWAHADLVVYVYSKRSDHLKKQDGLYRDRTEMNEDLLRTGDLSLTLKQPTDGDSGGYICTIYRDKDILRQKVVLQVKEPFPSWATVLLVLLGLLVLLVVSGGLTYYFRHCFMSGEYCLVEVKEGAESIQLPFETTGNLPEDATVKWGYCEPECRMLHVYEKRSDQPDKQDEIYKDRTSMNEDPLKTGDLSLTLKDPTERDSGRYRCEVKSGCKLLRRKMLFLKGRVQVQDQTGDIRNRSSSIDLTPLMADQSV
ncbi:uncharacterized protein LOC113016104 [Astatotilapia calliptera]|uniref:uncharacterized protein LOC113016104 n=1 Tax=Astatotilapia calliptera TaxID=8154 RepID=UPI000E40CEBE|nr:uncharacterized protein LOC113016104 [Astatotilapia calliptera]